MLGLAGRLYLGNATHDRAVRVGLYQMGERVSPQGMRSIVDAFDATDERDRDLLSVEWPSHRGNHVGHLSALAIDTGNARALTFRAVLFDSDEARSLIDTLARSRTLGVSPSFAALERTGDPMADAGARLMVISGRITRLGILPFYERPAYVGSECWLDDA